MSTKRSLALLGASSLLLSILPAAAFAQDTTALTIDKLAETANAQQISALWAKEVGKADHVLIATDKVFSDSLASGSLQGSMKAPLFFVGDKLDDVTKAAIKNLGATKATILGKENAISADVAKELTDAGLTVDRIGGVARIETSVAIAETHENVDSVIIARQDSYADALAAGALSAKTGMPIIVVNTKPYPGPDGEVALHPVVAKYLADHKIKNATVIGGTAAVDADVFSAIDAIVDNTERVEGAERIETAKNLAAKWGEDTGRRVIVEGHATDSTTGYYNGFAAALTAANNNAPVLLTNQTTADTSAVTAKTGVAAYCGTQVNTTICNTLAETLGATINTITLVNKDDQTPVKDELTITPKDVETLVGAATNSPSRVYNVANAEAGKEYTITLVNAEMKDGAYVPALTNKKPVPTDAAQITVVNGVSVTAGNTIKAKADADGKLTFTVAANQENKNQVVLPLIDSVTGGAVVIKPAEVTNKGSFIGEVISIDKENKMMTLKGYKTAPSGGNNAAAAAGNLTTSTDTFMVYYGNAGDKFGSPNGTTYAIAASQTATAIDAAKQINAETFEKWINAGDVVASTTYYDKASGLASEFTYTSLVPGQLVATKVKGEASQNAVKFTIEDKDLVELLKDGQVEVRYAKLPVAVSEKMQGNANYLKTTFGTDSSEDVSATFGYGYVSTDNDSDNFEVVAYTYEEKSSTSDVIAKKADDGFTDGVKEVAVEKTLKFSNASSDAKKFEFTVDSLDEKSSYAFTYRMILNNGEEGPWVQAGAAVAASDPGTDRAQTIGAKFNGINDAVNAAAKTADVFRTTAEPKAVTISSVATTEDLFNNGAGETAKLTFKVDGDDFKTATVDASKIEVVAASGGKATAQSSTAVSDGSFTVTLPAEAKLKDLTPDVEYTVNFAQGALTTNSGSPSLPTSIKFSYR